jgi:hypothetical protein
LKGSFPVFILGWTIGGKGFNAKPRCGIGNQPGTTSPVKGKNGSRREATMESCKGKKANTVFFVPWLFASLR